MTFKGRVLTALAITVVAAAVGVAAIAATGAGEWAEQTLNGVLSISLSLYVAFEVLRERGHLPSQRR